MSAKLFPTGFFEKVKPRHAKAVLESVQARLEQLPAKIKNVADALRSGDVNLEDLDFESEFENDDKPKGEKPKGEKPKGGKP